MRDLVKKAYDPASLRIAVLWQKGPDEEFDPESGRGAELEVVEISHVQSRGCNWARRELQKRWRGEPFTLILDSHHRFAQGWDQKLRRAYDALIRQGVEKPIVTAYLPAYNPLTDPYGRRKRALKIYPYARSDGLLLRLIALLLHLRDAEEVIPAEQHDRREHDREDHIFLVVHEVL